MDPNRTFGEMPLPLFQPALDEAVPTILSHRGKAPSYLADHRARLRERFMTGGAGAMPDYEMLELVLFRAIPRQDVKPLARRLIEAFGDFNRVLTAPAARLEQVTALAGLERTRLLRWIAASAGLSAVWFRDDGDPAEVDEAVARMALEALAAG